MENTKVLKATVTAVGSLLSSLLGTLYVPVLLMVACNVIDYITGLFAAKYRADGKISSYKSLKGVTKKVCMWLLVVVGAVIDELIRYAADVIGKEMPVHFLVACVVAVWIVCNELISILENMVDIGVDIPAFLMPIVKHIKKTVEDEAAISTEESTKDESEE
jgi:toxin secretion/phage lysis holin